MAALEKLTDLVVAVRLLTRLTRGHEGLPLALGVNGGKGMKLVIAAAVATLAAAAAPARAQPGNFVAPPPPAPVADRVSEDAAVGLSLGGTLLSWGLMFAGGQADSPGLTMAGAVGTLVAPSLGHWYAHRGMTRGFGIRALGLGMFVVGAAMALDDVFDDTHDDQASGSTLLLLGLGTYVVGTVDDIATAGSAARTYNRRFEDLSVIPTANAHGGGFAITGRF